MANFGVEEKSDYFYPVTGDMIHQIAIAYLLIGVIQTT